MNYRFDYVLATNVDTTGGQDISGIIKGVFVGTKKYMFFIPSENIEHSGRDITTTTFSFEGKTVGQFLEEKTKEVNLNVADFEHFMLNDMKNEFNEIRIFDLNEFEKLKVKAGVLGSGVYVKESNRKVGWKLVASKLGSTKGDIKSFYENHSKHI